MENKYLQVNLLKPGDVILSSFHKNPDSKKLAYSQEGSIHMLL